MVIENSQQQEEREVVESDDDEGVLILIAAFALAIPAAAQTNPKVAEVVALDECDPATFNDPSAVGADFCKNVALGASTTFAQLFALAAAGTPDQNWDFEPD